MWGWSLGVDELYRGFNVTWIIIVLVTVIACRRAIFLYALRKIPSPWALPIIGNAIQLRGNLEDFFTNLQKWSKEFGDIYLLWVGLRPFIFLYRVEAVQPLLSSSTHIDKSLEYQFLQPWLGSGLIVSTGEKWHKRRKLLTPTFHGGLQRDYFRIVSSEAKLIVQCLRSEIGMEEFDIIPYAKRAALDIICKCAMGHELNAQKNHNNAYVTAVHTISAIAQERFTDVMIKCDLIFKHTARGKRHQEALDVIHGFVDKVIMDRKREWKERRYSNFNESVNNTQTFLDLLLLAHESEKLTDSDIRDEVNTFIFAGHDTVGTCVSWTLYALGRHPKYQDMIVDEYEREFGDNELNYEGISRLHMLDICIKEAQRLYPVAPLIARQIYRPITLLGHKIPVGSTVLVNSYLLHRDPRFFADPERYRPERFDNEKHPNFTFIPFSAGSRNCIGSKFAVLELKILLISLLRAYKFHAIDTEDKLRCVSQIVLDNVGGIRLSISPR